MFNLWTNSNRVNYGKCNLLRVKSPICSCFLGLNPLYNPNFDWLSQCLPLALLKQSLHNLLIYNITHLIWIYDGLSPLFPMLDAYSHMCSGNQPRKSAHLHLLQVIFIYFNIYIYIFFLMVRSHFGWLQSPWVAASAAMGDTGVASRLFPLGECGDSRCASWRRLRGDCPTGEFLGALTIKIKNHRVRRAFKDIPILVFYAHIWNQKSQCMFFSLEIFLILDLEKIQKDHWPQTITRETIQMITPGPHGMNA